MRATQHGLTWSLPDAATHCTATALGPIVFSKFLLIWVMYIQCACMHVCVRGCVLIVCTMAYDSRYIYIIIVGF